MSTARPYVCIRSRTVKTAAEAQMIALNIDSEMLPIPHLFLQEVSISAKFGL